MMIMGTAYSKLRDAFNALDTSNSGEISMADVRRNLLYFFILVWLSMNSIFSSPPRQVCLAFRILTNRDLSVDDLKNIVASSNGIITAVLFE